MKNQFSFKMIGTALLVAICLIIGILLLVFGIHDIYRLNKTTENYDTVEGYLSDYSTFDSNKKGGTYILTYTYVVNGEIYTVSTDYGTGAIPELGSTRDVKYNPDNPEEAVLAGTSGNKMMIYMGVFFILGASIFIIVGLTALGCFDKLKIDIIGAVFGLTFTAVGVGVIAFAAGNAGTLFCGIKSFGPFILIPIIFVAIGIFTLIKALFSNKKENADD